MFGDFVIELDWAVGRILAALDATGTADNTLVIFTADNGAENNAYEHIDTYKHWSSGGLRGCKRDLYEGGHHVPFLARWPGTIPAGTSSREIICLTDIMATVAAIVGHDLPRDSAEDSCNILPALKGTNKGSPLREAVVHHSGRGKFAIRQGNWVLIDAPSGEENREPASVRQTLGVVKHTEDKELFNLADDPRQSRNVIGEHPELANRLEKLLRNYQSASRSVSR